MQKISKSNLDRLHSGHVNFDAELTDRGPRHIQGATITSWSGRPHVDLAELFSRSTPRESSGETVSGAMTGKPRPAGDPAFGTVSLSDGTKITFATVNRVVNGALG
jgi:hypothetical protein